MPVLLWLLGVPVIVIIGLMSFARDLKFSPVSAGLFLSKIYKLNIALV